MARHLGGDLVAEKAGGPGGGPIQQVTISDESLRQRIAQLAALVVAPAAVVE